MSTSGVSGGSSDADAFFMVPCTDRSDGSATECLFHRKEWVANCHVEGDPTTPADFDPAAGTGNNPDGVCQTRIRYELHDSMMQTTSGGSYHHGNTGNNPAVADHCEQDDDYTEGSRRVHSAIDDGNVHSDPTNDDCEGFFGKTGGSESHFNFLSDPLMNAHRMEEAMQNFMKDLEVCGIWDRSFLPYAIYKTRLPLWLLSYVTAFKRHRERQLKQINAKKSVRKLSSLPQFPRQLQRNLPSPSFPLRQQKTAEGKGATTTAQWIADNANDPQNAKYHGNTGDHRAVNSGCINMQTTIGSQTFPWFETAESQVTAYSSRLSNAMQATGTGQYYKSTRSGVMRWTNSDGRLQADINTNNVPNNMEYYEGTFLQHDTEGKAVEGALTNQDLEGKKVDMPSDRRRLNLRSAGSGSGIGSGMSWHYDGAMPVTHMFNSEYFGLDLTTDTEYFQQEGAETHVGYFYDNGFGHAPGQKHPRC